MKPLFEDLTTEQQDAIRAFAQFSEEDRASLFAALEGGISKEGFQHLWEQAAERWLRTTYRSDHVRQATQ